MVRLSDETERSDFLNVLAAERRELTLTITTDTPLRKSRTATQARRIALLREQASVQITEQLDATARRAFSGRIAVELDLSLPSERRHNAALPAIVKAYLDVLQGPVVFDDARVDHLLVLKGHSAHDDARALARCLPLSIFAADYDRAFKHLAEPDTIPDALPTFRDGVPIDRSWGLDRFDRYARESLQWHESLLAELIDLDRDEEQLLADDPDADECDLDVPAHLAEFRDWQVRANTRAHLERVVAEARGDQLADQGFDARDRPGRAPRWLAETLALDAADVASLDDTMAGCFVLPAPPEHARAAGEPDWCERLTRVFSARAQIRPWADARFGGPIALDVALRGRAGRHLDVDNAAHQVYRAFERVFGGYYPAVRGYRVYRCPGPSDDVRLRVLPAIRLELLSRALRDARAIVRRPLS